MSFSWILCAFLPSPLLLPEAIFGVMLCFWAKTRVKKERERERGRVRENVDYIFFLMLYNKYVKCFETTKNKYKDLSTL